MTRAVATTIPEALDALRQRVHPVEVETIPADEAIGRSLAQDIVLDRPSPPCDVSAMDGYAVQTPLAGGARLRVLGTALPGHPAPPMPPDADGAVRIFTGAPVPEGAFAVVQRERFDERPDTVALHPGDEVCEGMHIRRRGENGAEGETVCRAGRAVGPAQLAAIASCGITDVRVRRRLRVGVLITGDEVLPADAQPEAWCLRDSNGPSLRATLARLAWIDGIECRRVSDERRLLADAVSSMLERSDALIVTGGVSAGDHDYVPGVLGDLGIDTLFHKLAIRPGKPVLGAVDASGRPILGLPGNPVAVMVTAILLALPALRMRAGFAAAPPASLIETQDDACAPPSLHWFPLVCVDPSSGRATLMPSRGSGDWIAAARSDGFIEVPPGQAACGLRRFHAWNP